MKKLLFIAFAASAFAFTTTSNKQGTQLEGSYMSKKGANDNIACHGNNIGVLTQDTGERVIICFDELPNGQNIKISCNNLHVTGHYKEHAIPGGNGPCKTGKLTILYVEKYECMDGQE